LDLVTPCQLHSVYISSTTHSHTSVWPCKLSLTLPSLRLPYWENVRVSFRLLLSNLFFTPLKRAPTKPACVGRVKVERGTNKVSVSYSCFPLLNFPFLRESDISTDQGTMLCKSLCYTTRYLLHNIVRITVNKLSTPSTLQTN
jgi:hypothetical protein